MTAAKKVDRDLRRGADLCIVSAARAEWYESDLREGLRQKIVQPEHSPAASLLRGWELIA